MSHLLKSISYLIDHQPGIVYLAIIIFFAVFFLSLIFYISLSHKSKMVTKRMLELESKVNDALVNKVTALATQITHDVKGMQDSIKKVEMTLGDTVDLKINPLTNMLTSIKDDSKNINHFVHSLSNDVTRVDKDAAFIDKTMKRIENKIDLLSMHTIEKKSNMPPILQVNQDNNNTGDNNM